MPGYESDTYFGVFAPAKTPKEIVARLADDLARVLRQPDLRDQLAKEGAEPAGSTPQQLAAAVRADRVKWAKVIREAGVKIE